MAYFDCCKDCTCRYTACHSTCESYKEQKEEFLKRKEMIASKKEMECNLLDYKREKSKSSFRKSKGV